MSDEGAPRGGRTVFQPSPLQQRRSAETQGPVPADAPPQMQPPMPGQPGPQANAPSGYTPAYLPPNDIPRPHLAPDQRNPLMARAAPLLALLAAVRSGRAGVALPDLHRRCVAELTALQSEFTGRLSADHLRRAVYALAATADDVALNLHLPENERAEWAQRSLQVTMFNTAYGGDLFWRLLDEMVARPSDYQELLELYHACMAAGFEGRYRVIADGRLGHQQMMQSVYNALERARRVSQGQLSPHWHGVDAPASKVGVWAPLLMAMAIAAGLLIVVFIGYHLILLGTGGGARIALQRLTPTNALTLGQRDSATPTPAADDISTFLKPEQDQGLVSVTQGSEGDRVVTTAKVQGFSPGSANISASAMPLFNRIAAAINNLTGTVSVRVEGYTDVTKPVNLEFPDNQSLSVARAKAVQALIQNALNDKSRQVTAAGFGDSRPISLDNTPAGYAQNRRVEIVVTRTSP
jgi:type VI secretion system protein ImpK